MSYLGLVCLSQASSVESPWKSHQSPWQHPLEIVPWLRKLQGRYSIIALKALLQTLQPTSSPLQSQTKNKHIDNTFSYSTACHSHVIGYLSPSQSTSLQPHASPSEVVQQSFISFWRRREVILEYFVSIRL